jgi:hypothetical protein
MFFLMHIVQSKRGIAEPCLQDGKSISKWQIEAVGFSRAKKSSACLPSEGK